MRARLKASLPSPAALFIGAPLWGLVMMFSAVTVLYVRGSLLWRADGLLLAIYFVGAMIGFAMALPVSRFCGLGRRLETRFAATFFSLTLFTTGMTALIFAMQYRAFYAQWHDPFLTRYWILQFIFTSGAAVVHYVALGLRLYLPIGIVALFATSAIMAHRMR